MEWFAPEPLLQTVRSVMGGIDFEPALYGDGLARLWHGRVWLMPPFGRTNGKSNQALWTAHLIDQFKQGITEQAVLMVPACTSAGWFQPLYDYPLCFTLGRIRCTSLTRQMSHPTKGSAIVYFGSNIQAFREAFDPAWGTCLRFARIGDFTS